MSCWVIVEPPYESEPVARFATAESVLPNYCGTMPMAVYTFLEAFDFTGKTIHPFCTHEGSGLSNTVNDIKNTAKGATVTNGLPLFGSDADKAEGIVNDWIKKFNYTRR